MDWISRLNAALGYIEEHLDGEIDYNEICRITACPISVLQRFFMLATGIPLSEYIRRRKLTRACKDLLTTRMKIIDIAFKYAYESSDAFCVAFKRLFGVTPSAVRRYRPKLKKFHRLYFTLSITHIKEETEMILKNVDHYRVMEPLFEGLRVILSYLGESYTPDYIQGVSGAGFIMSGGCPSRPTCFYNMWTTDFVRYMGYEATEYPTDINGKNAADEMIDAVRRSIDAGRPALVWNAFTSMERDVVCGYDDEEKQFIGRGSTTSWDGEYARAPWNRAAEAEIPFGAIVIGEKKHAFDARKAELDSLREAVSHARATVAPDSVTYLMKGVQFYKRWLEEYSQPGKAREVADAYCHQVYTFARKAVVGYLREIAPKYDKPVEGALTEAAGWFEKEVACLSDAYPYLSWESPWGVDEERSKKVAPLIAQAGENFEKGIECIEKALAHLREPVPATV